MGPFFLLRWGSFYAQMDMWLIAGLYSLTGPPRGPGIQGIKQSRDSLSPTKVHAHKAYGCKLYSCKLYAYKAYAHKVNAHKGSNRPAREIFEKVPQENALCVAAVSTKHLPDIYILPRKAVFHDSQKSVPFTHYSSLLPHQHPSVFKVLGPWYEC
jgi:hypothetical protein